MILADDAARQAESTRGFKARNRFWNRSSVRQLYTANLASILPYVDSDFRLTRTRRNDQQLGSRDCLRVDRASVVHVFLFQQP